MTKNRLYFFSIFLLVTLSWLKANDSIVFKNPDKLLNISPFLFIYEDVSGTLSFDEIQNKEFEITKNKVPNLGISESVFWIKIHVHNASNDQHLLLDIALPTLDDIVFYYPNIKGGYDFLKTGEQFPFYQRKYIDSDYLFDLIIPQQSTKVYYFKISSKEGIQLPISIGTKNEIFHQIKNRDILSGLYFGIMIAMILYNLFIYFSVKDKNYLYYVIYIVFILITQTTLQGYPFQYLWPESPIFAQNSLFIFPSLVSISGIEFMRSFLQVKIRSKRLYIISYVFYIPYFISILLAFLGCYTISYHIMEISSILVSVFMLITSVVILRQGFQPAKYFLIAWSVFLVGICVYILKDFEILPFNNFTRYTMQIGSAIETILLSFALANRINILKREKEQSQTNTLLALKRNEKLIREQNIVLEQKVGERTLELRDTNDELHITLHNLKSTQSQLVNAEKMASLGQLTAGIAHEINNPINFVSANIKPLKMDINDVLELVKKYETLTPNEFTSEQFKEIEKFRKEIDFDYIIKEMDALLSGIEDGAKRTAEIVSGLKNFSRLDESDFKKVNINEGIESTLLLLKSAIPQNTQVITHLGDIPAIDCLSGKLNQVFMNLFSNALYAMSIKKGNEINKLIISTYLSDEQVYVSIEDSGIGMTPEVKAKLFDPFFTTKDVGQGTGLGMSIVFKIIQSHGAKIEVESEYGVGTKIILILNKKIKAIKTT